MKKYIKESDLEIHPDWFRNSDQLADLEQKNIPDKKILSLINNPQDKLGEITKKLLGHKLDRTGGIALNKYNDNSDDYLGVKDSFTGLSVRMQNPFIARFPADVNIPSNLLKRTSSNLTSKERYSFIDKDVLHGLGHEIGHVSDRLTTKNIKSQPWFVDFNSGTAGTPKIGNKADRLSLAGRFGYEKRAWDKYLDTFQGGSSADEQGYGDATGARSRTLPSYRFIKANTKEGLDRVDIEPIYKAEFLPKYKHLFIDDSKKETNMEYNKLIEDLVTKILTEEENKTAPPWKTEYEDVTSRLRAYAGKSPKHAEETHEFLKGLSTDVQFKNTRGQQLEHPARILHRNLRSALSKEQKDADVSAYPIFTDKTKKQRHEELVTRRELDLARAWEKAPENSPARLNIEKQREQLLKSAGDMSRKEDISFDPNYLQHTQDNPEFGQEFLGLPKKISSFLSQKEKSETEMSNQPKKEHAPARSHGSIDVTKGASLSNRHAAGRKESGGKRVKQRATLGFDRIKEIEQAIDLPLGKTLEQHLGTGAGTSVSHTILAGALEKKK